MSQRTERIAGEVRAAVGEVIARQEIKDPRVRGAGLITITHVRLAGALRQARVGEGATLRRRRTRGGRLGNDGGGESEGGGGATAVGGAGHRQAVGPELLRRRSGGGARAARAQGRSRRDLRCGDDGGTADLS